MFDAFLVWFDEPIGSVTVRQFCFFAGLLLSYCGLLAGMVQTRETSCRSSQKPRFPLRGQTRRSGEVASARGRRVA